jgi:hypothetical protein
VLKQEVAELLEEDAKADKLRSFTSPCIAAELLAGNLYVQNVMTRYTITACCCNRPE